MATFDISSSVMPTRQQSSRRVEWSGIVDFTEQNIAAGESAKLFKAPKGFVYEHLFMRSITAEGEAATFDIGTDGDPDAYSDGSNANLAAGSNIPVGGSPAKLAGDTLLVDTDIVIAVPAAAATLNVGKIAFTFVGFMTDVSNG